MSVGGARGGLTMRLGTKNFEERVALKERSGEEKSSISKKELLNSTRGEGWRGNFCIRHLLEGEARGIPLGRRTATPIRYQGRSPAS